MKAWEWLAWAVLSLAAIVFKGIAVFAAAMLGALLGLMIYVTWLDGTLWVLPLVAVAFAVVLGTVIGGIELYDHLDTKRALRRLGLHEERKS